MSDKLRVYKFYGHERALANLRQGRLKVSTVEDLNDPFEFRGIKFKSKDQRRIWETCRNQIFGRTGVICFSKAWDNPVLWSHYAENHRGLAIGLDVPKARLVPVRYTKTRMTWTESSGLSEQSPQSLFQKIASTKYKHWEYEDEVRTFVNLADCTKEKNLYFEEFGSDFIPMEVIIGPYSHATSDEIKSIPSWANLKVITSRIAFKSYRVVTQRLKRLQK